MLHSIPPAVDCGQGGKGTPERAAEIVERARAAAALEHPSVVTVVTLWWRELRDTRYDRNDRVARHRTSLVTVTRL
jgi:hypothetical protein